MNFVQFFSKNNSFKIIKITYKFDWATLKLQLRYIGAQTRVTADIRDRSGAGNLGVIQAVRRHHFSLDSHRFRTFIH